MQNSQVSPTGNCGDSPLMKENINTDQSLNNNKKQMKITDYDDFNEEVLLKEYTTTIDKRSRAIVKAQIPSREKLLEIVSLFDNSKMQYTKYPMYSDGGIVIENVKETEKDKLTEYIVRLYRKECGVDYETSNELFKIFEHDYSQEWLKARICTVIDDSVYVYDWTLAQDPQTHIRKYIMTWMPVLTKETIIDEHSREWMRRKTWQEYTNKEKEIFRMNNASLILSHSWILLAKRDMKNNYTKYQIMMNSFYIFIPTVYRHMMPHININKNDVAVQNMCESTTNINDVFARDIRSVSVGTSRYDRDQIMTSLFQRTMGKKYNGPIKPLEQQIRFDPSMIDKNIKNDIQHCHRYFINIELKEEEVKIINEVIRKFTNKFEATDELVKMLEPISKSYRSFHILCYLSNAHSWMRYGYNRTHGGKVAKDAKTHWLPISYKFSDTNNERLNEQLTDIISTYNEEVCYQLTGHAGNCVYPRYIAIALRVRNGGYRIVNGLIYDIYRYSQDENYDILKETDFDEEEQNKRNLQELFEISVQPYNQYNTRQTKIPSLQQNNSVSVTLSQLEECSEKLPANIFSFVEKSNTQNTNIVNSAANESCDNSIELQISPDIDAEKISDRINEDFEDNYNDAHINTRIIMSEDSQDDEQSMSNSTALESLPMNDTVATIDHSAPSKIIGAQENTCDTTSNINEINDYYFTVNVTIRSKMQRNIDTCSRCYSEICVTRHDLVKESISTKNENHKNGKANPNSCKSSTNQPSKSNSNAKNNSSNTVNKTRNPNNNKRANDTHDSQSTKKANYPTKNQKLYINLCENIANTLK